MSTESIASTSPQAGAVDTCRGCGAPMAEDQRYCLECGERRNAMSSVLLGGPPASPASPAAAGPPAAPPSAPGGPRGADAPRGNAVTVIAGVGVLLLAMGVGVLIGRSGSSKPSAPAAAQVISVSTAPSGSGAAGASTETPFSEDWPASTSGYTVQLQTLPQAGTTTSAVEAAKRAAGAKGAKGVGALLKGGSYVIYSGVYHKQAEAQKALGGLKKSFPAASVIKVAQSGGGAGSSGSSSKSGSTPATPGGSGGAQKATPKALEELHQSKGKSYEEKSKNLPDVVGT